MNARDGLIALGERALPALREARRDENMRIAITSREICYSIYDACSK